MRCLTLLSAKNMRSEVPPTHLWWTRILIEQIQAERLCLSSATAHKSQDVVRAPRDILYYFADTVRADDVEDFLQCNSPHKVQQGNKFVMQSKPSRSA